MKTRSNLLSIAAISLALAGAAQAVTLSFTNFDASAADNTLLVDGAATTSLTVTQSSVGTINQYVYSFSYSGADFDGDMSNDILSFDIRVQGYSGNTVVSGQPDTGADQSSTNGSVALDGTATDVGTRQTDFFALPNDMPDGSTLQFSIENFSVSASGYGASNLGFNSLRVDEGTSSGHSKIAIIGVGTGLTEREFNNGFTFNLSGSPQSVLYVSGAALSPTAGGGAVRERWGVDNIGFVIDVDAIPEPSSAALLGLGALGILIRRRR
ncbi:MAG: PEP-CTERM sorting domain-containing protein [Luteolibacter sp.]